MANKLYRYLFLILTIAMATSTISNTNTNKTYHIESECVKAQLSDEFSCRDNDNGGFKYKGKGIVRGGWFTPNNEVVDKDAAIDKNNVVDSIFSIFSSSNNKDNQKDSIKDNDNQVLFGSSKYTQEQHVKDLKSAYKALSIASQTEVKRLTEKAELLINEKSEIRAHYERYKKNYLKAENNIYLLNKKLKESKKNLKITRNELSKERISRYSWTEIYLFFAILLTIAGIVLISRNHRINIENEKDTKRLMYSFVSKESKDELKILKDNIIEKAKKDTYEETVKSEKLTGSKTRSEAVKEAKNEIKNEYKKLANKEELKQDVLSEIKKEILKDISKDQHKKIRVSVLNDLTQKAKEELISKHSKEVSENLDTNKIRKEVEDNVKGSHFIEIMDEVRNEYKKEVFDNLSDEEVENLKKEVYLETKQGLSGKSKNTDNSNQKKTSSTLDDFIDSL